MDKRLWRKFKFFNLKAELSCRSLVLLFCILTYIVTSNAIEIHHSEYPSKFHTINQKQTTPPIHDNNQKLVFKNCSNYAPIIDEELPVGTKVIQVRAEVEPANENSKSANITYCFLESNENKYAIDTFDGTIRIKQQFDRDQYHIAKVHFLNVIAMTHEEPEMIDSCFINITIKDINDNAPTFDKTAYTQSVPLDFPVGNEVLRVFARDIDDKENSRVKYSIKAKRKEDEGYFYIEKDSGVVYLNKTINEKAEKIISLTAYATDEGKQPQSTSTDVEIRVVPSFKKIPTFVSLKRDGREIPFTEHIKIPENYNDYQKSIVQLKAQSNIAKNAYISFQMIIDASPTSGNVEGTSFNLKRNAFRLNAVSEDEVDILLLSPLDYETINEYCLRILIKNIQNMENETIIKVDVTDVNDNMPQFLSEDSGSVLENQPIGTLVMHIQAHDVDASPEYNQVEYTLDSKDPSSQLFSIDRKTGYITTRQIFDREEKSLYYIVVLASDQVPSALTGFTSPNVVRNMLQISIEDVNDNPPSFDQLLYSASPIPENANVNMLVTKVKANDADSTSVITYSFLQGNTNDSFSIEPDTGYIRVHKPLDYETKSDYVLTVIASDGVHSSTTDIKISLININDNPPVFNNSNANLTIEEESLMNGTCITKIEAYDPDIRNRNDSQGIVYAIVNEDQKQFITIDNDGCMKLKKSLDRDLPHGYPVHKVIIEARDEYGAPSSLRELTTIYITLKDINDNAPFLNMSQPVTWDEGQNPGKIIDLTANDYDGPDNGAPFEFFIDSSADEIIRANFEIHNQSLYARTVFYHNEQNSYNIPIAIRDNGKPPMTGISTLLVTIEKLNDDSKRFSSNRVHNYCKRIHILHHLYGTDYALNSVKPYKNHDEL